jgi:hypothetical protein
MGSEQELGHQDRHFDFTAFDVLVKPASCLLSNILMD